MSWTEPKPAGGERRLAALSGRDAIRWHSLAGRIAEAADHRLSGRVLANRVLSPGPRWSPEPFASALMGARTRARRMATPMLLRTDVADFYPSVAPSALYSCLRSLEVSVAVSRTAAEMLEGWGSEDYRGLPIGPPGSAVVANVTLAPVDGALRPWPFLRWVDDYLIGVPSERAASGVLERMDGALDRLGLRRSDRKTELLEPGAGFRWLGASLVPTRR
ncbi:MAG: RNA-directed DNA polymerase [Actinomycetota bacterium]